jgi:autotransporter-associated beta strand protein
VGNNAALGTGAFTFNFNGAAGSRVLASSSGTGFTLNNDFNVFDDNITLGQTSGGTGSLVLGGTGKNFNLGSDGEAKFRTITVNGSHTIAGNLTGGANNSFIKSGSGTITLGGATNSFGGGLFIDAGVVNLTGANFTATSAALDIGGGVNGNAVNASDAGLRISSASSYGRNIRVNAETNSSGVSLSSSTAPARPRSPARWPSRRPSWPTWPTQRESARSLATSPARAASPRPAPGRLSSPAATTSPAT